MVCPGGRSTLVGWICLGDGFAGGGRRFGYRSRRICFLHRGHCPVGMILRDGGKQGLFALIRENA
jgi:hypothetical protein